MLDLHTFKSIFLRKHQQQSKLHSCADKVLTVTSTSGLAEKVVTKSNGTPIVSRYTNHLFMNIAMLYEFYNFGN